MTTREDVLLQIGDVRYKKGDGTLYVMNERLAWIAENRDTVAVSHRFSDIKMQKISPEGKPKVQLQVVLHDGNSSTFHFVNRKGQQAILADRDKVKELLQQLLPNFKRKIDKELEEKNRMLSENANLLQLYRDLVITQVITSEEFWATHAKDNALKQAKNKTQEVGVSGAFLADIKPTTDGCNGLKYNLTPDIIDCVFRTYPAVKRKHSENVPDKMSEAEFWTKFFQSHYFHRDRITGGGGTKDIFSECGKIDDSAMKTALQKDSDPLLNIKEFEDIPLEEGFGGANNDVSVNSGNIVHQNIIKRFNQHSMMVLQTFADVSGETSSANGPANANPTASAERSMDNVDYQPVNKQRIIEKIHYDDLGDPDLDVITAQKAVTKRPNSLKVTNTDCYFHGPVQAAMNTDTQDDVRTLDLVQMKLIQITESWQHRSAAEKTIDPTSAVNALGELSPGGDLMRGFQEQSVGQLIPPEFEQDLRNLYLSLSELLKQFWSCFPPTTPEREEKATRLHEAILRFHEVKIEAFENRVARELQPVGSALTQHLHNLVQVAGAKYATWQERKMQKKR